jgi:hypothetical protein
MFPGRRIDCNRRYSSPTAGGNPGTGPLRSLNVIVDSMNMLVLLITVLTLAGRSQAVDTQPCLSPEAREFDFWIGDWIIEQKILQQDGSWLKLDATTSVSPDLNGCAIVEHWEGSVQFFWEG